MNRIYSSFYALAWCILSVVFGWAVAPTVETMFFPVYSKFKVVSAEQTPEGVIASFEFIKYRECEPKGLTWYLGEVGASTTVNASAPEGTRTPRPIGPNTSSPYLLEGITLLDLDTQVIARLRNQCSDNWFGVKLPWISTSDIYP